MSIEVTAENAAAAAAYERTIDVENYTTRRVLTVGRSSMVHAIDETYEIWAIKVGHMAEGKTMAQALCGQQSPSYNRNHGHKASATPVAVECKKCKKVMDRISAFRAAKAAEAAEAAQAAAEEAAQVEAPEAAAETATEAPEAAQGEAVKFEELAKGDKVQTANGDKWVVTQPALDGKTVWVRPIDGGKPVRRAWKTMTRI